MHMGPKAIYLVVFYSANLLLMKHVSNTRLMDAVLIGGRHNKRIRSRVDCKYDTGHLMYRVHGIYSGVFLLSQSDHQVDEVGKDLCLPNIQNAVYKELYCK